MTDRWTDDGRTEGRTHEKLLLSHTLTMRGRDVASLVGLEKVFLERKKKVPHPHPHPHQTCILVGDTLSRPVLFFRQVSSKYCEGYSSYRVDRK